MPRSKLIVLLLLASFLTQSGKGWGWDCGPKDEGEPSHLESVRTYALDDFRQPLLDRLSGGLNRAFPYRMATDSQGRILVTDFTLSVVHVFDVRQEKRWQIRGDFYHRLSRPAYIAVDNDDNIYVTDLGLGLVVVFRSSGEFLRTIGYGSLSLPTGIWVDGVNRMVYVADWWRNQVLLFDFEGNLLRLFGNLGRGPGQLHGPGDIVIHGDSLIVLDTLNLRFELFDLQGNFRTVWPFGSNRLPLAFAFDREGNLVYVDLYSGGLVATDPQGTVLARFEQVRPYGQAWPVGISFMCVATDSVGDILALRPTLHMEAVRLAAGPPTQ
jgi:DNA-binding beta-propeller fold protein YncE